MRIIGYIRYSTTEQGQRTSPALQLAALEKCAERHGKELSATFHDALPGSAPLHKRPGLQDALAALEAGDILIVYRLDRLARDLELQIRLFRVQAVPRRDRRRRSDRQHDGRGHQRGRGRRPGR